MKKRLSLLLLSLSFHAWSNEVQDYSKLHAHIQNFIEAKEPIKDSGFAIKILKDSKPIYEHYFGWADRKNKTPINEKTHFAIGSVSKSFTSFTLAMLQEEGKLSFKEPIQSYLPEFSLSNPEIAAQTTLEDTLSHRVGLPRHDLLWVYSPFSHDQIISALPHLEMNTRPSMGFRKYMQYNNLMYLASGMVLERISNQSWENFIRERIFKPLQMNESNFSYEDSSKLEFYAKPYDKDLELKAWDLSGIAPAGAIYSNVHEMTQWVELMLNKGQSLDGQRFLSASATEDLWKERSRSDSKDVILKYGLGWMVSEIDGKEVIWHNGSVDGYTSFVSFYPEEKISIIILTNQSANTNMAYPLKIDKDGKNILTCLPYVIYDLLFHESKLKGEPEKFEHSPSSNPDPLPDDSEENMSPVKVTDDPFGTWAYVGEYSHPGYGSLKIHAKHEHLKLHYYKLKSPLVQVSNDLYIGNHRGSQQFPFVATFQREDGEIRRVSVSFERDASPIVFEKLK